MGINMPGYKPASIEAIGKALEAVHSYYGIDTQKAQTRLAEIQAEKATRENEEEKQFAETGQLGPNMALKAGYTAAGPASPLAAATSGAPAEGAAPKPAAPESAAAQSPQAPQSPLLNFGRSTVTLKNGQTMPVQNLKLGKEQADLVKTTKEIEHLGQQMVFAANEDKRKGETHLESVSDAFNKSAPVIEAKDDISGAQAVEKALASGNKADIQLAKAKLPLLALGIKRLGGEGESLADSKKLTDMLDEYVAAKEKGLPTPEAINMLSQAAGRIQASAGQRLDDLANHSAQQVANARGLDPAWVKSKLILPLGTQMRETKPPRTEKPKSVVQGGHTYHLNEKTGKYE